MKRFIFLITLALSLFCLVSCTQQEVSTSTPRPLAQRNEILKELQAEYNTIKAEYDSLENDDSKKKELMQEMTDNLTAQGEVIKGINGEENYNELCKAVEESLEEAELYNNLGDTEKSDEILEKVDIIMYGNKEGKKTW